jgi:cobalt/nickel transport system permease protein
LRFLTVDEWSLRDSRIHRRDARAKLLATFITLLAISRGDPVIAAVPVVAALAISKLPTAPLLLRGCVVLPFSLTFAAATAFAGRPELALLFLLRSYLSAICMLVLIGTTSLPSILNALRWFRAPAMVIEVVQFIYRYLFLIGEQTQRMAMAAKARGARRSFAAVAGAMGVLFARSYDRAEAVHRAMLARGYKGFLPSRSTRFGLGDLLLLAVPAIAMLSRWRVV